MQRRLIAGLSRLPPSIAWLVFATLILLATMPAWRVVVFGMTTEDWLQLRCF
jgi:hypothetical protein